MRCASVIFTRGRTQFGSQEEISSEMFKRNPRELQQWLCEDTLRVCGKSTGFASGGAVIKKITDKDANTQSKTATSTSTTDREL